MKKKNLIIIIATIILLLIAGGVYYTYTKQDKKTTLNLIEKQWIDKNKNSIIDVGLVNNIPVFNYDGNGVFFEFLKSLETITGLELNKVSFQYGDKDIPDYSFNITNETTKNDILLYNDEYVIVTKNNVKFQSLGDVTGLTIGVLESELTQISNHLKGANDNVFKPYDDVLEMFNDITSTPPLDNSEEVPHKIDALVVPKTIYLKDIIKNNLHISYNITEMNKKIVLTLGKNDKLNNILKKYYDKWEQEQFVNKYNNHLTNSYFAYTDTEEKEKVDFRSKRYTYGFVETAPYDTLINNKLKGYNSEFLKQFSKIANIEINFKNYKSIKMLLHDFNSNKLDIIMDNHNTKKYDMDVYETVPIYNNSLVVISHMRNNLVVNSLSSLQNVEIVTLKGDAINNYLLTKKFTVKTFNNITDLTKNINKDSIVVIDSEVYNYFANSQFKNYKVFYKEEIDKNYNFIMRDIKQNKIFNNLFNFYLSYNSNQKIKNVGYYGLFNIDKKPMIIRSLIILFLITIITTATVLLVKYYKKTKKKIKNIISKEDKIKYIDMLTSLKNRNYLNDNIEVWDESEVYPQTIIVIDLNNIAYINDNYGHSEGDVVIKDAANILIKNQIENSDIIRTDGNEFLVYLVGHEEKEVISYIRKLNKEFKDLAHGFGSAIGYSMIMDAIKTVDDAIIEATLDMRDNKESEDKKLAK